MTPIGLRLARLLAAKPGDVGEIARAMLEAEGHDDHEGESSSPGARRQRAYKQRRQARASPSVTLASFDASAKRHQASPESVSGDATVTLGDAALARREKTSHSLLLETRSKSEIAREAVTNGASPAPSPDASPERYLSRLEALTPELMSIAQLATVQDIPAAWAKFCGHFADKWIHVSGRWQVWCVNEAKRERAERDKRGPVSTSLQNGMGSDGAPAPKRKPMTEAEALEHVRLTSPDVYAATMAARALKGGNGGS